jgi:hypothetical protein
MKALVVGVIVLALQAIPPWPPHWREHSVVPVWIDASLAPEGGAMLVERAMKTWTDAARGRLTFARVPSRPDAAIRVLFLPSDTNYGETAPRVDPVSRLIVAADVAINAHVGEGSREGSIDTRIILYLTALHELGHAIGLPHTDDFRDIMYSFRRPGDGARYFGAYRQRLHSADDIGSAAATGLSAADVTALRSLYGR